MTACDLWQNKKSSAILTKHHLKVIHFTQVWYWWYSFEMYLVHFYLYSWTLLEIFMKSVSDSYTECNQQLPGQDDCIWISPKQMKHQHFMHLQTCCDGQTLLLKPRWTWMSVSRPIVPINSFPTCTSSDLHPASSGNLRGSEITGASRTGYYIWPDDLCCSCSVRAIFTALLALFNNITCGVR